MPENSTPRWIPQKNGKQEREQILQVNCYHNVIDSKQKVETAQVSMDGWMHGRVSVGVDGWVCEWMDG